MKVRIRIVVLAVAAVYFLGAAVAMDYHSERRIAENLAERFVVYFDKVEDELPAAVNYLWLSEAADVVRDYHRKRRARELASRSRRSKALVRRSFPSSSGLPAQSGRVEFESNGDFVAENDQEPEGVEKQIIDECEEHYNASAMDGLEVAENPWQVKRDWEIDDTLGLAIRKLARKAGVNAILSETLSDSPRIRVHLKNLTALEAMQQIARDAGAFVEERNGDYFFMSLSDMTVYAPPPPIPIRPGDQVIPSYDKKLVIEVDGGDIHTTLKTIARAAGVPLRMSRSAMAAGTVNNRLPLKTPVEAIQIIVAFQRLELLEVSGAFVVLTKEEMQAHYDRLVPIIGK